MTRSFRALWFAALVALVICAPATMAEIDEDDFGAWYMYFFNTSLGESQWGLQGDVQWRNWNLGSDLEQLLIRGGLTWQPASRDALFTLGYANVTSGEFGDSDRTINERRIYQEAALPQKIGGRVYLRHRFRYEQRWVESQSFRTRYRYALSVNVPFNGSTITRGTWYVALYNELFINGQQDIGDGRTVEYFDRNRIYGALGYGLTEKLRLQGGYMHQYSDAVSKGQLQLSLHHQF